MEPLVDQRRETGGRGEARHLLPIARTAGYVGSDRNFRSIVAELMQQERGELGRHQRRPAVWMSGEMLVIDWSQLASGLMIFCEVLAWSRIRFVRVVRGQTASATLAMLAAYFDQIGRVPAKVLTDRMGCLRCGTVAGVMIPTPDFVMFATHHRSSPNSCHPADPESKDIVENLVGYARGDLVLPTGVDDLAVLNEACRDWYVEANARQQAEI